jgi:hypothetical protein
VGTLYPQKLAITSPTSAGRSVGIVRSRTQTMEFLFFFNDQWITPTNMAMSFRYIKFCKILWYLISSHFLKNASDLYGISFELE